MVEELRDDSVGYKLAYDEMVRALASQPVSFQGLKTQTGTLLGAAAIVTSFLGGQALDGAGKSVWT